MAGSVRRMIAPTQRAEGEGEQRVGDGGDAALPEVGGPDAVAVGVERQRPPREQRCECGGHHDRGGGEHDELGGEPPAACDPLCPGEPVGPELQLAGEQRRAPERTDRRRHPDQHRAQELQRRVDRREVLFGRGRDVLPGGDQDDCDDRSRGNGDEGLGSGLSPGEPRHDRTAASGAGRGVGAVLAM